MGLPGYIGAGITGLFIPPFVLFAGNAAQLADKFEKARIMSLVKRLEIGVMAIAAFGWATHNLWLLVAVLLEVSLHDLQTITGACGYANATSFRWLFQGVTGINPSESRARFRLRPRRPRWKVELAEQGCRQEVHATRQGAAPARKLDGN